MRLPFPLWLRLLSGLALWCLLAVVTPARASGPVLTLSDSQPQVAVWPAVRILADPARAGLSPEELLAHPEWFVRPSVPEANLGVHPGTQWLRLAVTVPANDQGRWILEPNFPTLDNVEVFVAREGRLLTRALTGDQMPLAQRPLPSRTMGLPITMTPGARHDLLIRIDSEGSSLVPMVLHRASAYPVHEVRFQLVQGLLAGIGLCLLAYSLVNWVLSRDRVFLYYAICQAGVTGFFFSFHGLGSQHLWPESPWMMRHAPLLGAQIGLIGSALFADQALRVREIHPRASLALRALAAFFATTLVGQGTDVIPYGAVHMLVNLVGVVPMAIAVPVAIQRTREGEPGASFMLLGWSAYAIGVVSIALLLRGHLPVNPWTLHVFQASSVLETLMWMAVLGRRNALIRDTAAHAERERRRLSSLAQADPLTGLANRRGLQRQAGPIIAAATTQAPAAVMMLDLDGFKPVNDQHGHDAGDRLLIEVAARLRRCVRQEDCVARTGGDEFVLTLSGLSGAEDAQAIARKVARALQAPFEIDGLELGVSATIGYALAPEDGDDWQALLKAADRAMYEGKTAGRRAIRRAHRAPVEPMAASRAPASQAGTADAVTTAVPSISERF